MFQLKIKKRADLLKRVKILQSGDFRVFLDPAGRILRDNIISNIKHQIQPDGAKLKSNSPEVKKIKQRLLGHSLSLIWDRLLISRGTYIIQVTKSKAKILLKPVRRKIAIALEARGYIFFGIGQRVRQIIYDKFIQIIRRGLRRG